MENIAKFKDARLYRATAISRVSRMNTIMNDVEQKLSRQVIQEFLLWVADVVVDNLLEKKQKVICNYYLLDLAWLHLWILCTQVRSRNGEQFEVGKSSLGDIFDWWEKMAPSFWNMYCALPTFLECKRIAVAKSSQAVPNSDAITARADGRHFPCKKRPFNRQMGVTKDEYNRSHKSFKDKNFKPAYNVVAAQLMNDYWFFLSKCGPCASYGDNATHMKPSLDDLIALVGPNHLLVLDGVFVAMRNDYPNQVILHNWAHEDDDETTRAEHEALHHDRSPVENSFGHLVSTFSAFSKTAVWARDADSLHAQLQYTMGLMNVKDCNVRFYPRAYLDSLFVVEQQIVLHNPLQAAPDEYNIVNAPVNNATESLAEFLARRNREQEEALAAMNDNDVGQFSPYDQSAEEEAAREAAAQEAAAREEAAREEAAREEAAQEEAAAQETAAQKAAAREAAAQEAAAREAALQDAAAQDASHAPFLTSPSRLGGFQARWAARAYNHSQESSLSINNRVHNEIQSRSTKYHDNISAVQQKRKEKEEQIRKEYDDYVATEKQKTASKKRKASKHKIDDNDSSDIDSDTADGNDDAYRDPKISTTSVPHVTGTSENATLNAVTSGMQLSKRATIPVRRMNL